MSAAKHPDSYPAVFPMLVERFTSFDAEPVEMELATVAEAEKIRFTFYSYRKALDRAGQEVSARVARGIVVQVTEASDAAKGRGFNAVLRFSLRDNQDWALSLERALQGGSGAGNAASVGATSPQQPAPPKTSDEVVERFLAGGAK